MTNNAHDLTQAVLDQAVESLANLHGVMCVEDPGVRLKLLARLDAQLRTDLAATTLHCHHYGYAPQEITDLLHHPPQT